MKKRILLGYIMLSLLLLTACGNEDNHQSSESYENSIQTSESVEVSEEITIQASEDTSSDDADGLNEAELQAAKDAAEAYYAKTVFEVISMEVQSQTTNSVVFTVCASKGGVVQEPNRSIYLSLRDGVWEVTNEGY